MKRAFDVIIAALVLLVAAPIMLVVGIATIASIGRPILFSQQRPGLGGKPFRMYKFRTMRNSHDANGRPLPDAQRITQLGAFLRQSSLDELPELYNVLKGDMSLVGPRPLLMAYLDRYSPFEARRHEARPGVTGWAQINGRNALSWPEKFALDVWYIDHRSLSLDFRILALTAVKVIRRDGISAAGEATMPEFTGGSDAPEQSSDQPHTAKF